jgi:hypothetical protein
MLQRTGIGLTLAFVVLRSINIYGDPVPWAAQPSMAMSLVSYLNLTKYPPSLLFLLMTLGPALLILKRLDRHPPARFGPVQTFGRVPLFYFVLHFALIHTLAVLVCVALNGSAHWMFESPDLSSYPFTPPPHWGFSLPAIYLIWALVVIAMYPLSLWYANLKRRRREAWWSFF